MRISSVVISWNNSIVSQSKICHKTFIALPDFNFQLIGYGTELLWVIQKKLLHMLFLSTHLPLSLGLILATNFSCLAVTIRLLFNPPDALWLWHWRKGFVIVVHFKMTPQRDNRLKVSALLRAWNDVSEVANLVGFAQSSTRSRSAWTVAKVSTDVQAVVERLL